MTICRFSIILKRNFARSADEPINQIPKPYSPHKYYIIKAGFPSHQFHLGGSMKKGKSNFIGYLFPYIPLTRYVLRKAYQNSIFFLKWKQANTRLGRRDEGKSSVNLLNPT